MYALLYQPEGRGYWSVLKRYKTLGGAKSGMRAHAKRFGFGGFFCDIYDIQKGA